MARLIGVDLPREKRVEIGLTYIFGVGRTTASQALAATGISPDTRVKNLTDADLVTLRDWLEANVKMEGDLRREVAADIRRKVEIGSYEGLRHRLSLIHISSGLKTGVTPLWHVSLAWTSRARSAWRSA